MRSVAPATRPASAYARGVAVLATVLTALCALPAVAAAQNGNGNGNAARFPTQERFQKVTLNPRPGEPMSLAVLPDGRVLHTSRRGQVWIYNPRNGLNTLVINMADTTQNPRRSEERRVGKEC